MGAFRLWGPRQGKTAVAKAWPAFDRAHLACTPPEHPVPPIRPDCCGSPATTTDIAEPRLLGRMVHGLLL